MSFSSIHHQEYDNSLWVKDGDEVVTQITQNIKNKTNN